MQADAINNAIASMSRVDRGGIYHNQPLCHALLNKLDTSVPLQILQSNIHGTGLFAKEAIPAGADIFISTPFLTVVGDAQQNTVCDYCYISSSGMLTTDGRLRHPPKDPEAEINRCLKCGVCGYCSDHCSTMAWVRYHIHECEALGKTAFVPVWTRMMYRFLAKDIDHSLLPLEWEALSYLWVYMGGNHPASGMIGVTAMEVETLMKSGRDDVIRELVLYRIAMNAMPIITPSEGSHVSVLDFVGSFINHSCDPNAFLFLEGRTLRMRSLRPINAGEEITRSYMELEEGMVERREALRDMYSFVCNCIRCETEIDDLKDLAIAEDFSLREFYEIRAKFVNFKNEVLSCNNTIDEMKLQLTILTDLIFPYRPWPSTVYPMGEMKMVFARLYANAEKHDQAVIHALQGCLATTLRYGPNWVRLLHALLNFLKSYLTALIAAGADSDSSHIVQDYCIGILNELVVQAKKVFGTNAKYTLAVAKWRNDNFKIVELPLPGYEGFAERFGKAQKKMLSWAGIHKRYAVVLSEY
ncbi:hypothetical protein VE03_07379 [Pseudogymnoascus sp. 23342-1-I1]|nr:hypothetical protein VE03_07379 [Pseudogymnoascus sp. 23342-1-I1]